MTLRVADELETRLEAVAKVREMDPSSLAEGLLSRALDDEEQTSKVLPSAEELMAGFQKLAATATAVPVYPDDFFSRDIIYADHD